jgi:hypothetical protein
VTQDNAIRVTYSVKAVMLGSSTQTFSSSAFAQLLGILTENNMTAGVTLPTELTKDGSALSLFADTGGGSPSNTDISYKYSLVRVWPNS